MSLNHPPSHPAMEAEGKSPPEQHMRRLSLPEPRESRAKRSAGNAAVATENTAVAVFVHPPRQLEGDATASSSASDVPCSTTCSIPAMPGAAMHFCGHCQKRFRSPARLAQHERVHTTEDTTFYCSFCPKQFGKQGEATRHERTHTGENPYACSMCPRRFTDKSNATKHERTHTGE